MRIYNRYISLLSILSLVVALSGCVNDKDDSTIGTVDNITVNRSDTNSSTGTVNVSGNATESEIDLRNINTNVGTEWCVPGNKITIDQGEFTVVGITNYVDTNKNKVYEDICKAERITKDENSFIYFNKGYLNKESDQFFAMKSSSTGKNAHANASVSVVGKK